MTVSGVVNKTGLLVGIAVICGALSYKFLGNMPAVLPVAAIAGFLIVLGFGFFLCKRPELAKIVAPIYAVVEGIFLGALTSFADQILAAKGMAVMGGVALQAFVVTAACFLSVLGLYRAGIIRPSAKFNAFMKVAVGSIMLAYLASFIMSFFGAHMPLISFGAAVQDQGLMGLLGLGINLIILGIASLTLVQDFALIDRNVEAGVGRKLEWYAAYGLLLSLAWIYYESVKLVIRVAMIFGSRD